MLPLVVIENPAPMWAQVVKIQIKNIPPSNKIFFLRPRRRHRCHQSYQEQQREKSSCSCSGREKHLNVTRAISDSWCCRSSSQNKTTQHREFSSSSRTLFSSININPNKLVAIIEEGFNRGSVGSAREPLWMEV